MRELLLDEAKTIIADCGLTVPLTLFPNPKGIGRDESLLKFTRLLMAAEVASIPEIDRITREANDLTHLSGVHKFRYATAKADEIRWLWSRLWMEDKLIHTIPHLRDYIGTVCENRRDKRGHPNRPYGLFVVDHPAARGLLSRTPWRTPEWYEARKPIRLPKEPLSEFYPYITKQPTEEHAFLIAVDSLVPKHLPNQTRADVCQDMIVAILTGDVTLDNLRDGLPKYLKMFMKGSPSKYGHLSLDAPVGYGDERTLAQKLGL